ncbi:MAG: hypothetical protein GY731_04335 [Gammaproteobacteria bacterium]|nr:hypothetical protein [Gammaproteobacteria bacterium]
MKGFRRFIVRRVAVLTVLLTVATGLSFLGRWHWVLDLFSHFTFHYGLVSLPFIAIFLLFRCRGWALLGAVVCLVNGWQVMPYWLDQEEEVGKIVAGERIRLLQFNVNKETREVKNISSWLETGHEDLDIVVLLETSEIWKPHLDRLRQFYPHQSRELLEDNFGIAVLSRLPTRSMEIRRYGAVGLATVVLTGETREKGIPFVLYATHPPPPISGLLSRLRNEQLTSLARDVAKETIPARILAGDLNTTVWSYWFRKLVELSGLRDAQFGQGYLGTWPAFGVPAWLGIPIDQTLISKNIRTGTRVAGPSFDSDHRSITTVLWLQQP